MEPTSCTAFEGARRLAAGDLRQVALAVKAARDAGRHDIHIFDDLTAQPVELDLRGLPAEVMARLPGPQTETPDAEAPRGPGRPRLGVVAREVTLLPRHWEWLGAQPGGASVALRKLVEDARKAGRDGDRRRLAQEAAYRFMSAMAGNEPGFEEAARALFAGDPERLKALLAPWPTDLAEHVLKLAAPAMES